MHSVFDDLRTRLDFHEPIDIYVVKKARPEIKISSYLGTHVILIEGDFVGDIVRTGDRTLLTCLLAQPMGALKARYTRFTVVDVLINSLGGVRAINFLLLPYLRATRYSGDQIAHACCGSLDSGLAAIERQMIGKHLQHGVGQVGIIEQAETHLVRLAPRLTQLLRASPHLTNRYLNLLSYSRDNDPASWQRFCSGLDAESRGRLDRLIND